MLKLLAFDYAASSGRRLLKNMLLFPKESHEWYN